MRPVRQNTVISGDETGPVGIVLRPEKAASKLETKTPGIVNVWLIVDAAHQGVSLG